MTFQIIPFPDPNLTDKEGLVAVGGELSSDMIISAYIQGIFPWFNEGDPILWWSPDPRMVLFPEKMKVSDSLRQSLRNQKYCICFDTNFREVMTNCASVKRKGQDGTWISPDMIEAYTLLHEKGIAHSVEVYSNQVLKGGLYGLAIGKAFFGESMFHHENNTSKIALYYLCQRLISEKYHFIDVQQSTNHLKSLGAENISRSLFLKKLSNAAKIPADTKKWN